MIIIILVLQPFPKNSRSVTVKKENKKPHKSYMGILNNLNSNCVDNLCAEVWPLHLHLIQK